MRWSRVFLLYEQQKALKWETCTSVRPMGSPKVKFLHPNQGLTGRFQDRGALHSSWAVLGQSDGRLSPQQPSSPRGPQARRVPKDARSGRRPEGKKASLRRGPPAWPGPVPIPPSPSPPRPSCPCPRPPSPTDQCGQLRGQRGSPPGAVILGGPLQGTEKGSNWPGRRLPNGQGSALWTRASLVTCIGFRKKPEEVSAETALVPLARSVGQWVGVKPDAGRAHREGRRRPDSTPQIQSR